MEFNNQNEERTPITAKEFLELLKKDSSSSESINLDGLSINESISLNSKDLSEKTIRINFNNCSLNYVSISKIESQIDLNFRGCTILNLGISQDFQRIENSVEIGLSIHKSNVKRIFVSRRSSISLDLLDSTIGEIESRASIFTDFECRNVSFKNKLVIENSKFNIARFEDCSFEKYFTYYGSIITDKLTFKKCLFKDQFIFALKEKSTDLSNLKINIESCETDDRMIFYGKYSSIENLFSYKQKGNLVISDLNILNTEIQGSHERNASYRFSSCNFNSFRCVGINSTFQLSTIKSLGNESVFSIKTSDLNTSSFFDVNLKSFDSVIIEKSDFTNMTTSRVTWFEDKKLKTTHKLEYETPYERREFYRQLKYNQEKQGNKIQALTFQSLEMHYYSQELISKSPISNILLKNRFIAFFGQFILAFKSQNHFILWIGKSNNHGQSFLKPLAFLVVLGLIFNFLILQSASPQSAMELFKKGNLKMLPSLLNPVHDISKLLHVEEPSFWTGVLDLTWKVIETTLIFQTITAFRKHVRV
ncbi:MAG: hypothetical protein V4604_03520 [Bacteroidota bacterium]